MTIYLRKSLRAGPFRFNLSKSGVGVSVGVKGFRLGSGPRGNYVHMGRDGLYYRSTIPGGVRSNQHPAFPASPAPLAPTGSLISMKEIDSVSVLELRDSSSADLLDEMNRKHQLVAFWPIVLAISILLAVVPAALALPWWSFIIVFGVTIPAIFLVHSRDQINKTTVLFYELEEEAELAYQNLHKSFKVLCNCSRAWHVSASGKITNPSEQKRHAGASELIKRKSIQLSLNPPPYVSTNLAIPCVPVGSQKLYFFPDRVLVYENGRVGAVSYSDLNIQLQNSRFIEEEAPRDAQVVDHTWRYVNKSGGPDKRFRDNRQLPICFYGEIHFTSQSGLNELIQLSKPNIGGDFDKSIQSLKTTYFGDQPEVAKEKQTL